MPQLPFPTLTPAEAAALVNNGDYVCISGFTSAGSAKLTAPAIAAKARAEHEAGRPFKIGVVSSASLGPTAEGAFAEAEAVSWRTPYQTDPKMRKLINAGKVDYFDMHLSQVGPFVRSRVKGQPDWAIIEVADLQPDGTAILTSSVGASPTFIAEAKRIIVEINAAHKPSILGLHDIYDHTPPPNRGPIPLMTSDGRIGSPTIKIPVEKIAGVVYGNLPDEVNDFTPTDAVTARIGDNVAAFIAAEIKAGRLNKDNLVIQSGVGNVGNAVMEGLGRNPEIPPFRLFSEVIQDSIIDLLASGRMIHASGTSLALSRGTFKRFYDELEFFRGRILLRPQEVSNNAEMVSRLGLVSVNTALEADLVGNVNSTHVLGRDVMNGIGGSADFTRNAAISVFTCPSIQKDGRISTIVPLVSHMDHNEHSVQILITEQGIADLRGKGPRARAEEVIEKCAHPEYRPLLREYLKQNQDGHHFQHAGTGATLHRRLKENGDMRVPVAGE